MDTNKIRIVDVGRGPQIEGLRVTVMDVFYYLHRGYDFEFIQRAMPSLTREQFEVVVSYVDTHRDDLAEKDRRIEEFQKRGIATQRARGGIFAESEPSLTTKERVDRLRQRMTMKLAGRLFLP